MAIYTQKRSLPFWLMIVSKQRRSSRLAVADDHPRWPRPTGTIASIAFSPVCTGWETDWRAITPGATFR